MRAVRTAAGVVALAAPVAGHVALRLGHGYGVVLALAAAQAVAAGALLWLGGLRRAGVVVALVLLAGMAAGAGWSARTGVLAASGLGHAMLYAALLALFARTLRPGHDSLVTQVARRVNPGFHAGMVPYTRKVTAAWCALFAGQLGVSATLLAAAPAWWPPFVSGWHVLPVLALAAFELAVRKWRWRHEHPTGLKEMIRGVRSLRPGGDGGAGAAGRT